MVILFLNKKTEASFLGVSDSDLEARTSFFIVKYRIFIW